MKIGGLGKTHAVSIGLFLVPFILFLVGIGSPMWYDTGLYYGGLWKNCTKETANTTAQCYSVIGQAKHGNWVGSQVLLIISIFAGVITGVVLLLIVDEIRKSNAVGTAYGIRSSLFTASALLHLLTTTLIIVGSLMFPFETISISARERVQKDWAFFACLVAAGGLAVNSFLQMGIMTHVSCNAESHDTMYIA